RNFSARNPRSLRQVHKMRLRIKPGPVSRLPQTTIKHSGHRTLTLGARNMHGAKLAMRIADEIKRCLHPLKLVNLPARLQRIEPVDRFRELFHVSGKFSGYHTPAEEISLGFCFVARPASENLDGTSLRGRARTLSAGFLVEIDREAKC